MLSAVWQSSAEDRLPEVRQRQMQKMLQKRLRFVPSVFFVCRREAPWQRRLSWRGCGRRPPALRGLQLRDFLARMSFVVRDVAFARAKPRAIFATLPYATPLMPRRCFHSPVRCLRCFERQVGFAKSSRQDYVCCQRHTPATGAILRGRRLLQSYFARGKARAAARCRARRRRAGTRSVRLRQQRALPSWPPRCHAA